MPQQTSRMKPTSTSSAGGGSTVNSSTSTPGINNKYGTTYHAIRQLLKEIHITHHDFDDDKNDTTMLLSLTRQDLARLDELRRLLCASWMEHCDCHASTTGSSDATTNASGTIEKWYTFLRNSRATLVNQLCQRLQSPPHSSSSSLSSLSLSSYRLLVCRTFWGVVAGTPIPAVQNNDDDDQSDVPPSMMMIDAQLLQRFVRAVVGNNRNSENAVSDDLRHGLSDTTWTLHPNDIDSKALYQFLCHECIQPHRDVQYYLMSSIHTVACELYAPDSHNNSNAMTATTAVGIERLLELLMMIPPVATNVSPQEFARSSKSFIPTTTRPQNRSTLKTSNRLNRNDNEDDDNSQDDDDEEEDEDSEESDDDHQTSINVPSFLSKKRYINMMTKAWLSLLRLRPLSEYIMKQSLLHLPKYILPMTSSPLRFADFFHFAYGHEDDTTTSGGATNIGTTTILPILALEGLFYLMIEHGLEYTNYYKQLYRLLRSSSIYYIKYRITFFKLLYNSIMKNDALPAHIIAAFAKRLLRQALYASPSSIMFLLTFVSNILRKHPEISCLIHRNGSGSNKDVPGEMDDRYDAVTDDPEFCHALQSSLWELNALQHHYYSGVVTLAKSIGTENYKQTLPYDCTGDFLTLTYTTIFEQERSRNKKQSNNKRRQTNNNDITVDAAHSKRQATTPLAFRAPTTLFTRTDIFSTILSLSNIED